MTQMKKRFTLFNLLRVLTTLCYRFVSYDILHISAAIYETTHPRARRTFSLASAK
jgi:hypothetical protein